jgi:hypothetical protein
MPVEAVEADRRERARTSTVIAPFWTRRPPAARAGIGSWWQSRIGGGHDDLRCPWVDNCRVHRKEVKSMRRFRWSLLFLIGVIVIGAGASSVLAGQATKAKTAATYWNNVIEPTTAPSPSDPVPYLDTAQFQFGSLPYDLYGATEVDLNFHGHVHSIQTDGGSGFATTLSVTVKGVSTGTFIVTLANSWRPHVAFNNNPEFGQDAYGALKLPTSIWKGAKSLTVTVKSMTTNAVTYFTDNPLLIGYVTLG